MVESDEGWITLSRKLLVNSLWRSEPFSKGQAWVDLLLLANHSAGFFFNRGIRVDVARGQVGMSELQLSLRWKWSRTKVNTFLKLLEKEQQIVQQKNNVNSLITIINYDRYQPKKQQKEQQQDNNNAAEKQQQDTNKNEKNEKNEKEEKQQRLSPAQVKDLFLKYAGLLQVGSGQYAVLVEISEKYPAEVINEAFMSGAGGNKRGPGFLNWCIKRMENRQQEEDSKPVSADEGDKQLEYYRSLGYDIP